MMTRRVPAGLVPPWLEPLLATPFFAPCAHHADAARSECNMYCLDCAADAFCFYCRSDRHSDHRVIQVHMHHRHAAIRRSSYHDVVRVAEVNKLLDIAGVQTYVINSARVVFLNERPQPRGKAAASRACEACARALLDPFRFCSLGCKFAGIKRNGNACFVLRTAAEEGSSGGGGGGGERARLPAAPAPTGARRRKGVPHRAPLGC